MPGLLALLAGQVGLVSKRLVESELCEVALLLDSFLAWPHPGWERAKALCALAAELLVVVLRARSRLSMVSLGERPGSLAVAHC